MFMNRFQKLLNKMNDELEINSLDRFREIYPLFEMFCRGHHRVLSHLIRHLKASLVDGNHESYKFDVKKSIAVLEQINNLLFELVDAGKLSSIMNDSDNTAEVKECFKKEIEPRVLSIEKLVESIERDVRKYIRITRNSIKKSKKLIEDLEKVEFEMEDFE